jgi:integrase/recombinase XerD
MKPLAVAAADYLALRRGLGFKLRHETWWLPDFVAFLDSHRSPTITTELALRWAQQPPDADPSWWAKKLGAIRRFAHYLHACDPRTEVPPVDLLPYRARRLDPHIYTDAELAALLAEAHRLPNPLTSATYTTLLGLLAASRTSTGLRSY